MIFRAPRFRIPSFPLLAVLALVVMASAETAHATRYAGEFLLSVAPLRVDRGTGSPVNPIAVF
jgi:hypothetical protein